jgi:biotin-(acetyl-CoA carboxylase) ligase
MPDPCPPVTAIGQIAMAHPGLWVAIVAFLASSLGIILGIGIGLVWKRMERMEKRQEHLREETLPKDYVRKDALEGLKESVEKFVMRFEDFMQTCREGKCIVGRIITTHHPQDKGM